MTTRDQGIAPIGDRTAWAGRLTRSDAVASVAGNALHRLPLVNSMPTSEASRRCIGNESTTEHNRPVVRLRWTDRDVEMTALAAD